MNWKAKFIIVYERKRLPGEQRFRIAVSANKLANHIGIKNAETCFNAVKNTTKETAIKFKFRKRGTVTFYAV